MPSLLGRPANTSKKFSTSTSEKSLKLTGPQTRLQHPQWPFEVQQGCITGGGWQLLGQDGPERLSTSLLRDIPSANTWAALFPSNTSSSSPAATNPRTSEVRILALGLGLLDCVVLWPTTMNATLPPSAGTSTAIPFSAIVRRASRPQPE